MWTAEGRLYVAAVIDLFSRRVIGWSMSAGMMRNCDRRLVKVVKAIWRRGKPHGLLHRSDRGGQYTSEQSRRPMANDGVIC